MKSARQSIRSFFKAHAKDSSTTSAAGSGSVFKERFKMGNELGKGAFAVVHAAKDNESGDEVAIKVMQKKALTKVDLRALEAEVRILESIEHPNVVRFYGMWEDDKTFNVVMELVKGGELFDLLVSKTYLNESDAAGVVRTVTGALAYLHKNGIVHRDIKPENILMEEKAEGAGAGAGAGGAQSGLNIKLADFGFAKDLDHSSEEALMRTTCGTPGYVAPEIISGKAYDAQVDMWSLGVIVYILLCGYPPFYHENQQNLFRLIKKAKFKFDESFWGNVSDQAKDLVTGLLVVDPAKRLTAEDVLKHPWIVRENGEDQDITPALGKLRGYQAERRLKKHVNAIIALKHMEKLASLRVAERDEEDA